MNRRRFIAGLGGAAAWSVAARAQQPAKPVVGLLYSWDISSMPDYLGTQAFREGLSISGYVENRNVILEVHSADGQYDRLPAMATDLVRRRVNVLFAAGAPAAVAAKSASTTIPIVFFQGEDPVDLGLVQSLARPGGNMTGAVLFSSTVLAKRLELLHDFVPQARAVALLVNPDNPNAAVSKQDAEEAARRLGLEIHLIRARAPGELDGAFASLGGRRVAALLIAPDGLFATQVAQLAALANRYAIPASHETSRFPVAGGLMSYSGSIVETWRQAGVYVGRVLKGEKPGDLPIVQPTKFEMVINLKAAKALGLAVPPALLATADEVIE
jgi:putative ABC transport system substrate-binding protein